MPLVFLFFEGGGPPVFVSGMVPMVSERLTILGFVSLIVSLLRGCESSTTMGSERLVSVKDD